MSETQAYRVLFNETDFVTVTFDPPSISAFDDDDRATCGGVWSRDLSLSSPTQEMSFAERRAVRAENRKKIEEYASAPDPHSTHRTILSHAVTVSTPETLLSYAHAIGPASEVEGLIGQGVKTSPSGSMAIGVEFIPIVSVIDVVSPGPESTPNTIITMLPRLWKIEPV